MGCGFIVLNDPTYQSDIITTKALRNLLPGLNQIQSHNIREVRLVLCFITICRQPVTGFAHFGRNMKH